MATGRMQKHHYSNEFKITAIRLASLPGTLIQDVAGKKIRGALLTKLNKS